ncbi:MAG: hypothetical protein AAAB35_23245 [Phyllobacterium sp.]|uniref:hypothetical protein n=1 Tax=Phyllobacterium sp. TaxID=1871046 RepID=UPI0030EFC345
MDDDAFMEHLKKVISDYQTRADRLIIGIDHIFGGRGGREEISIETAAHYKRLISHYKYIVTQYEAKKVPKQSG